MYNTDTHMQAAAYADMTTASGVLVHGGIIAVDDYFAEGYMCCYCVATVLLMCPQVPEQARVHSGALQRSLQLQH